MVQSTLDPDDWDSFRASAHAMLDDALQKMQSAREGRVWTPMPEEMKAEFNETLPLKGVEVDVLQKRLSTLLPYGVGNTHPRFFGWVHGAGNAGGILAEMTASAMNANLGGRDHGAIYVEKQVVEWCRQIMNFPEEASGLIVSGTSMATIIALKAARDKWLEGHCRVHGLDKGTSLVGYASEQSHSCLSRAFDILGLGSASLRKIPCNDQFQMDLNVLESAIAADRGKGNTPFVVIGTVGSVNVGAIDDIKSLVDMVAQENLWLHIDGAFGATAILGKEVGTKLVGLDLADSLAFDFHKWLQVNYDAGCVLIRSKEDHFKAFAGRAEYLTGGEGLAAGNPWPVDFGPELSRGFRALKIWAHLVEHGVEKLGDVIDENCQQARYLGTMVEHADDFELLAPVMLNIVCFRYVAENRDLAALNLKIVTELQERGIAAPSTTIINGNLAIRVNITNHRTEFSDLDLLFTAVGEIGKDLVAQF